MLILLKIKGYLKMIKKDISDESPKKFSFRHTHTQEKCSKTFTIAGRDNNGSISNTLECIMYVYNLSQVGTTNHVEVCFWKTSKTLILEDELFVVICISCFHGLTTKWVYN